MKNIFGLILLISTCVSAAEAMERCRVGRDRSMSCAAGYALFEFAPASGAGMGTACACAAVTGAKDEVMTFTRASTGWCTKSASESAVAVGEMVECGNNLPRIMRGVTSGSDATLGIDVWAARTNKALRSQEFDNAAVWAPFGTAPTVTANAATAPDGTTTAERVEFAATLAAEASYLGQNAVGLSGTVVHVGVYVAGNGTTGTLDLCQYNGTTTWTCTSCSYVAHPVYTRCKHGPTSLTNDTLNRMAIGNLSVVNGGIVRSAADVFVWQGDAQANDASTDNRLGPPITTAGTAATRVVEAPSFAVPTGISGSTGSSAATAVNSGVGGWVQLDTNWRLLQTYIHPTAMSYGGALCQSDASMGTVTGLTVQRWYSTWNIATGVQLVTPTATGPMDGADCISRMPFTASSLLIGNTPGGATINGVIKKVCIDNSTTRCR